MSGTDWRARLAAQGVDPARIDEAEASAGRLAAAAEGLARDPEEPALPGDIVRALLAARDRR